MNNSDGTGIFDALLPQDSQEQPETSAVEPEVEASGVVDTETEVETEVEVDAISDEGVETDAADEDGEDIEYYQIGDKQYSLKQLDELEANGLRQADYTKKSQANAELKKELDVKNVQINEKLESLDAHIKELEKLTAIDSEVDMNELRDIDPSEYLKRKEQMEARQKASESAKVEMQALKDAEFQTKVAQEQKLLLEALPEWQDPVVMEKDAKLINDYLAENGFTESDTNDLVNHRLYVALLKAAKMDSINAKSVETEKKVKDAPKVTKASKKTNKKTAQGVTNPHSGLASVLYG